MPLTPIAEDVIDYLPHLYMDLLWCWQYTEPCVLQAYSKCIKNKYRWNRRGVSVLEMLNINTSCFRSFSFRCLCVTSSQCCSSISSHCGTQSSNFLCEYKRIRSTLTQPELTHLLCFDSLGSFTFCQQGTFYIRFLNMYSTMDCWHFTVHLNTKILSEEC